MKAASSSSIPRRSAPSATSATSRSCCGGTPDSQHTPLGQGLHQSGSARQVRDLRRREPPGVVGIVTRAYGGGIGVRRDAAEGGAGYGHPTPPRGPPPPPHQPAAPHP